MFLKNFKERKTNGGLDIKFSKQPHLNTAIIAECFLNN